MSASSVASSSSSRSSSPEAAQASSSSAPASRPSNNTANTSRYIPPLNYRPASFPTSTAVNSKDLQSSYSAQNASSKQLWVIRIPDGIDPAQLDGLRVSLPESGAAANDKPLATLTNKRRDANGSSLKVKETYQLFASSAVRRLELPDNARNSQAGMKKSKAKQSGDKSQLVEEAEGSIPVVEGNDGRENFAGHMQGLKAYLPVGGSEEGLVTAAPLPITQYMEFVMATPGLQSEGDDASFATGKGPTGRRKLRNLSGYFAPSGSLYDESTASGATAISTFPPPSQSPGKSVSGVSEKKRKGVSENKRKKTETEAGEQADKSSDGSVKKAKQNKAAKGQ